VKRNHSATRKDFDLATVHRQFKDLGINLSEVQLQQFEIYYQEILQWNSKANLISKRDEERIVERHFLESAALSLFDFFRNDANVLDVGSGAGFPGVPIKLIRSDISLVLMDSNRMKTIFLKSLVEKLSLDKITVICERAEQASKNSDYLAKFDVVLSRAVAQLVIVYELAKPFLKSGGLFITLKGSRYNEELQRWVSRYPKLRPCIKQLPYLPGAKAKQQKIIVLPINC
jgi:16S rRNA (guanine527-N7)-methyltransferase